MTAAPARTEPPAEGEPTLALLARAGLVTHLAEVDGADAAADDRFRRQAAGRALSVIALGPGRFGLYLPDRPLEPLSDQPYRLRAVGRPAAASGDGLQAIADRLAAVEELLADRLPEILARLGARAEGRATPGPDDDDPGPAALSESVAAALAERVAELVVATGALERRLDSGTPAAPPDLSELQVIQRSMRNFWLAQEKTLERMGALVERMESAAASPHPDDGLAGRLAAIESRLDACREAEAGAVETLRLQLAELLARQAAGVAGEPTENG